jgi:hypothetical protein
MEKIYHSKIRNGYKSVNYKILHTTPYGKFFSRGMERAKNKGDSCYKRTQKPTPD